MKIALAQQNYHIGNFEKNTEKIMSRKKIVAGNWKMNKDYQAGLELISEAVYMIKDELHKEVTTIFATPYIHLSAVSKLINSVLV